MERFKLIMKRSLSAKAIRIKIEAGKAVQLVTSRGPEEMAESPVIDDELMQNLYKTLFPKDQEAIKEGKPTKGQLMIVDFGKLRLIAEPALKCLKIFVPPEGEPMFQTAWETVISNKGPAALGNGDEPVNLFSHVAAARTIEFNPTPMPILHEPEPVPVAAAPQEAPAAPLKNNTPAFSNDVMGLFDAPHVDLTTKPAPRGVATAAPAPIIAPGFDLDVDLPVMAASAPRAAERPVDAAPSPFNLIGLDDEPPLKSNKAPAKTAPLEVEIGQSFKNEEPISLDTRPTLSNAALSNSTIEHDVPFAKSPMASQQTPAPAASQQAIILNREPAPLLGGLEIEGKPLRTQQAPSTQAQQAQPQQAQQQVKQPQQPQSPAASHVDSSHLQAGQQHLLTQLQQLQQQIISLQSAQTKMAQNQTELAQTQAAPATSSPSTTEEVGHKGPTDKAADGMAKITFAAHVPGTTIERKSAFPIDALLAEMMKRKASDLHLTAGEPVGLRIDGEIIRLEGTKLTYELMEHYMLPIMPPVNREEFAKVNDTDFAYEVPGLARFRVNMFRDLQGVGAVLRQIPATVLSAAQLNLPPAIRKFCELTKGLVVVTGPTGSGKSTTLAGMIDLINETRHDHILTIEDPVEFVHKQKHCLVNQREVHKHTTSFKRALKAALREDPDIILIGELRDLETIAIAIETAETGHLVFGTLHTNTAVSTVDRIIDQFPSNQQAQIRVMLAESLKGVVAQILMRKKGGGRIAAHEILVVNKAISSLIREGKTHMVQNIMQTQKVDGNILMNETLLNLVTAGICDAKDAYLKAVDKDSLLMLYTQKGIKIDVSLAASA